ncbi:hypothetical protein NA57DRAFT_81325 [Rhizodiscina lignyota]|uniref:Uncharacterized protein n=1 Tax=Rhizodiscina lignyota TaxID=1504668 RepID=A0A9P4I583_9PEZI|nr:hypothetical protein NA57DRAFT_81325 [Rhizodiscina lignyota]
MSQVMLTSKNYVSAQYVRALKSINWNQSHSITTIKPSTELKSQAQIPQSRFQTIFSQIILEMFFSNVLLAALPLLGATFAATATLQFDLGDDTFTSDTVVTVDGPATSFAPVFIDRATIAEVDPSSDLNSVTCKLFSNGKQVGGTFNAASFTDINSEADSATCAD